MRDELLPLLDKPVMLIGRLTAKEREGSSLRACIKNPRVYKWSRFLNEEQIESQRPIKTDHLWIYAHVSSTIGDVEDAMLANIKIYSHLSYYTRADGSTDIGLIWTPCVKSLGSIQFYYLTHKYEEVCPARNDGKTGMGVRHSHRVQLKMGKAGSIAELLNVPCKPSCLLKKAVRSCWGVINPGRSRVWLVRDRPEQMPRI